MSWRTRDGRERWVGTAKTKTQYYGTVITVWVRTHLLEKSLYPPLESIHELLLTLSRIACMNAIPFATVGKMKIGERVMSHQ